SVVGPGWVGDLLQAAGAGRVSIPTHRKARDRDQPGATAAITVRPQRKSASCGVNLGWRDGKAVATTGCMTLASELPNDVETLKQLILEGRRQRQAEAERFEAEKQAAIDEAVKAAVAAILRRYYGPRSESFDPRQLLLFGQRIES